MSANIPVVEYKIRDMSVNPRKLRSEGSIPATVYAKGEASMSVAICKREFSKLYKNTSTHFVTLKDGSNSFGAVVKNVQDDPISSEIMNVEFLKADKGSKISLTVAIVTENTSIAVKNGGVLLQLLNEIEVEALPGTIPENIVADLSKLEEMESIMTVAQLNYPEGVVPKTSQDAPVFKVKAPKVSDAADANKSS